MAYTIYDDILDNEGRHETLPCANFFLRKLAGIYGDISANVPEAKILSDNVMEVMDEANIQEQRQYRVGMQMTEDHTNLADRSIGHALGPLTMLLSVGYGINSPEHNNILTLFRHYLIARQLHDDAHDWEDDLSRGYINSTSAMIKEQFREEYSGEDETIHQLRKIFWESTINEIDELILFHITAAREARSKSELLIDTNFMENTLGKLEMVARNTVREHEKTVEFLAYYRTDSTA